MLSEMGSRIKPGIIWGAQVNLSVKMLGPIFQPPASSFLDIRLKHFERERYPKFVSFKKDTALVDEALQPASIPAISDVMHRALFRTMCLVRAYKFNRLGKQVTQRELLPAAL